MLLQNGILKKPSDDLTQSKSGHTFPQDWKRHHGRGADHEYA